MWGNPRIHSRTGWRSVWRRTWGRDRDFSRKAEARKITAVAPPPDSRPFFPSKKGLPPRSTRSTSWSGRAFSLGNPVFSPRSTTRTFTSPFSRVRAMRVTKVFAVGGSMLARKEGGVRFRKRERISFSTEGERSVTFPSEAFPSMREAIFPISSKESWRSPGAFLDRGDGVSSMSLLLRRNQFEIGRLQGILVEEAAYPLLPRRGGGDFPEHTRVIRKPGGKPVFVSVLHGEQGPFRRCFSRGADLLHLLRSGGRRGQDRGEVPSSEKAVERLLMPRSDGVPVLAREAFSPGEETASPPDGDGEGGCGRNEFVGQPHLHGRVAVHPFALGAHLRRSGRPHQPKQALHAAVSGDDPQFDLGLSQGSVFGHDPVMGAHRQLVSAPQGVSVDDGDHGEEEVLEFREDGNVLRGKSADHSGGLAEELLHVRSPDEPSSRPRQHEGPHLPPLERPEGTKLPHGRGQLG